MIVSSEEDLLAWFLQDDGSGRDIDGSIPEGQAPASPAVLRDGASSFPPSSVPFVVTLVHDATGRFLVAPPLGSSAVAAVATTTTPTTAASSSILMVPEFPAASASVPTIVSTESHTYEDSFPALSAGIESSAVAMQIPIHHQQPGNKKKKKRIRSTLVTASTSTAHAGNIASLPSSDEHISINRHAVATSQSGAAAGPPSSADSPPRHRADMASLATPPKSDPHEATNNNAGNRTMMDNQEQQQQQQQFGTPSTSSRLAEMLSPTAASASGALSHLGSPKGKSPQHFVVNTPRTGSQSPSARRLGLFSPVSASSPRGGSDDSLRALALYTAASSAPAHVKPLLALARLFGSFVLDQLVDRPSEVVYLFRLLRCTLANPGAEHSTGGVSEVGHSFFMAGADCVAFAAFALAEAVPLLQHLDVGILNLMVEDPILVRLVPQLVSRLRHAIDSHRHRALGLSSRQPGAMPRNLRVGGGPSHDLTLPFREETDSRHHFRTADQSRMYSNRESSRDAFLRLLRAHQDIKRRFDDKRLSKITREFPGEVDTIMSGLLPCNLEWFAGLFVSLLARTALDNETDEDVLGDSTLAKADPSRLQKLHQRLSSKPRSEEAKVASSHRRISLRNGFQQQNPTLLNQQQHRQQRGFAPPQPTTTRPDLGEPADLFLGTSESFFFQFLEITPSAQFVRHVEGLLVLHIAETAEGWLNSEPHADDGQAGSPGGVPSPTALDPPSSPAFGKPASPGMIGDFRAMRVSHALDSDDTVDRLVEMKLLARFLGFLTFRSHWPLSMMASTPLVNSNPKSSVALDTALKDAVRVEERFSWPPPLKVQDILDSAIQRGQLVLLIPWLVEYLKMMRWDLVFRGTSYYKKLLLTLRELQSSPELRVKHPSSQAKLAHFNDNRGLVSFELEALFRELGLLAPLPLPPSSVLKVHTSLACVDTNSTIARRCYARRLCLSMDELLQKLLSARLRPIAAIAQASAFYIPVKKVRPHTIAPAAVRAGVVDSQTTQRDDTATTKENTGVQSVGDLQMRPSARGVEAVREASEAATAAFELKRRLQATFFRRHPALQRLADFVLDSVVKNCCMLSIKQCADLMRRDETLSEAANIRRAQFKARRTAELVTEEYAPIMAQYAMGLLCPLNTTAEIRSVAIDLTVRHVLTVGLETVVAAVTTGITTKIKGTDAGVKSMQSKSSPFSNTTTFNTVTKAPLPLEEATQILHRRRSGGKFGPSNPPDHDPRSFVLWSISAVCKPRTRERDSDFTRIFPQLPRLWSALLKSRKKEIEVSVGLRRLFTKKSLVRLMEDLQDPESMALFVSAMLSQQLLPSVVIEDGLLAVLSNPAFERLPHLILSHEGSAGGVRLQRVQTAASCSWNEKAWLC